MKASIWLIFLFHQVDVAGVAIDDQGVVELFGELFATFLSFSMSVILYSFSSLLAVAIPSEVPPRIITFLP